jgi:hypothetical protein
MIAACSDVVVFALDNQSTIGPHGFLLWPGTVKVILCHRRQNHWMVLSHCWPASAWLQHPLRVSSTVVVLRLTQNKQWCKPCAGASALFVHQVHFRAHRSLLPIVQSPIRLIVVRSSTPSLTRCLSHCTWVPAKSGGDCWHDPHILLGDVRTHVFVVTSAINNIDCHVVQPDIASREDNTKVFD